MSPLVLNRQQIRRFDQAAIQTFGISGLVLMENAGRGCADVLCQQGVQGPVVICCGKGNNGGDGLVMARHLDVRGIAVTVILSCPAETLPGDAATNYEILTRTTVPILSFLDPTHQQLIRRELEQADWIVDGLLGIGAQGPPRKPLDAIIQQLNAATAQKLAIDVPSGLDCDTGERAQDTFCADHTATLVVQKPAFLLPAAQSFLGQVHVLDIGTPPRLAEQIAGDTVAVHAAKAAPHRQR